MNDRNGKVALITGGAKRIGRQITKTLHDNGYDVIIHYGKSDEIAKELCYQLNAIFPNSAFVISFEFHLINNEQAVSDFKEQILRLFGRVDCIIHNASSFYPSDLNDNYQNLNSQWNDLFLTNAKAPFFLSYLFQDELKRHNGNIISILDIHADNKPYVGYPIYTMAKSAHRTMVQSLALEFAPTVRVNGVSPGVNVLPIDFDERQCQQLKDSVPLGVIGTPQDIADTVLFLLNASYITGQVISVDGGRSLTLKGG